MALSHIRAFTPVFDGLWGEGTIIIAARAEISRAPRSRWTFARVSAI
jgi:hypothetical protein